MWVGTMQQITVTSSRSGSAQQGGFHLAVRIDFLQKRSGSMRVGRGLQRGSVMVMIQATRTSQTTDGMTATVVIRRIQWVRRHLIQGDCMTCTVMSGSGARTGMAHIPEDLPSIRRDLP